jgi:uncharacterized membrane protein
MDLRRIARHLLVMPGALKRAFPPATMAAIEQAIAAGEREHSGEVRFAAEAALDIPALFAGQSARERAIDVFSQLRVWDTAENNGVLIYLLLSDHDIEIVADRGINARVKPEEWEAICRRIEEGLRRRDLERGLLDGIEAVSGLLARHFPPRAGDRNELADRPAVL